MLDIVASNHCMQFQGKLMNETWENGKKCSFNRDFVPFGPNSGCHFFFSKTRCHGFFSKTRSSCTISEKTNYLILRKLSDGRTERQTDRQEWFRWYEAVRLTSSVQNLKLEEDKITWIIWTSIFCPTLCNQYRDY